jgi:hypothetical protein
MVRYGTALSKTFFFEKKKQKTSVYGGRWPGSRSCPQDQSFFASFCSQKEALTFFLCGQRSANPRANPPSIARRIDKSRDPVAIVLGLWRADAYRASRQGPCVRRVHIRDIQAKMRRGVRRLGSIRQHDKPVAERDFGMHDTARLGRHHKSPHPAETVLEKFDQGGAVGDD